MANSLIKKCLDALCEMLFIQNAELKATMLMYDSSNGPRYKQQLHFASMPDSIYIFRTKCDNFCSHRVRFGSKPHWKTEFPEKLRELKLWVDLSYPFQNDKSRFFADFGHKSKKSRIYEEFQ